MKPAEDIFAGPTQHPPAPLAYRTSRYRPVEDAPTVRHVSGYAAFLIYCSTHQVQPQHLAGDLPALVFFLRAHFQQVQHDTALAAAATVFMGNALVAQRPGARWQRGTGGGATVGTDDLQIEIDHLLERLHLATETEVQLFLDTAQN